MFVCAVADGLVAVDPSSDWNAPTELWGNYEEPAVDTSAPAAALVSQQVRTTCTSQCVDILLWHSSENHLHLTVCRHITVAQQ